MATFLDKIWSEYPVPKSASIWGEESSDFSLSNLISSSVDELSSDIYVTDSIMCTSQITNMPTGCRNIVSAKLAQPFQGNTFIKKTYLSATNQLYLRYFPATVKYQRDFRLEDLDTVRGDTLIYIKNYILLKMVTKELSIITSVKLDVDSAEINAEELKSSRDQYQKKVDTLKEEILIYVGSN